jgi:hypothetical protein
VGLEDRIRRLEEARGMVRGDSECEACADYFGGPDDDVEVVWDIEGGAEPERCEVCGREIEMVINFSDDFPVEFPRTRPERGL